MGVLIQRGGIKVGHMGGGRAFGVELATKAAMLCHVGTGNNGKKLVVLPDRIPRIASRTSFAGGAYGSQSPDGPETVHSEGDAWALGGDRDGGTGPTPGLGSASP